MRSIYRSASTDSNMRYSYEERTVLFHEVAFENAIAKARKEAEDYIQDSEMITTDYFSAFEIYTDGFESGTEVFSLIRDSDMENNDYVNSFYDTGGERVGPTDG